MTKPTAYLCFSLILGTASPVTLATPISAVIGLSDSQIVEASPAQSLTPISGTWQPLTKNFMPITHTQSGSVGNWLEEVGLKIRLEHKQRDLNFTGTLTKVDQNSRTVWLSINDRPTQFPLDDFYLIPLEKNTPKNEHNTIPYQVSYKTNQLTWSPQQSLIFENDQVTLSQQALISNNANTQIDIQNGLLHYSRRATPTLFKAERSSLAMSDAKPDIHYQDNEITYPLEDNTISIPAYSTTLIALPSHQSKIEQQTQKASLHTYSNTSGEIDLRFYNNVRFSLPSDGFPGEYNTFWKKGDLLIPSNSVVLNSVRAKSPLTIATNKSHDITGYLTLVSASSEKLPNTQVWKAIIENHSDQTHAYSIEHSMNGIVELLEGEQVTQPNAKSLLIEGKIKAGSTNTVTYKVTLKN
ncbi:hypothetical protein N5P32_16150 [Marinomonas pontica]|uniref:hypothetical protein n=1 Tax=Marinomonas pontica TaxID=264739 RepID=UPI002244563C|nr:hypothetical protein [Marinomonas pontica]MCW8357349.1 hypothetical protein [Marinomonas pontica]